VIGDRVIGDRVIGDRVIGDRQSRDRIANHNSPITDQLADHRSTRRSPDQLADHPIIRSPITRSSDRRYTIGAHVATLPAQADCGAR
jgi:hypothetical protein